MKEILFFFSSAHIHIDFKVRSLRCRVHIFIAAKNYPGAGEGGGGGAERTVGRATGR